MPLFKRKIVKFNDGTYAIRTYWCFGWHFHGSVSCKDDNFRTAREARRYPFYKEAKSHLKSLNRELKINRNKWKVVNDESEK